jgi:hypothetical protein
MKGVAFWNISHIIAGTSDIIFMNNADSTFSFIVGPLKDNISLKKQIMLFIILFILFLF